MAAHGGGVRRARGEAGGGRQHNHSNILNTSIATEYCIGYRDGMAVNRAR